MFAGAEPIHELAVPRFSARPSPVDVIVTEGKLSIAGTTIEAIPMPGHTGTHTCYRVGRVLFLGDLLSSGISGGGEQVSFAGRRSGFNGGCCFAIQVSQGITKFLCQVRQGDEGAGARVFDKTLNLLPELLAVRRLFWVVGDNRDGAGVQHSPEGGEEFW